MFSSAQTVLISLGWWMPLLNIMTVSWQVEGPLHTCSVCSPLFQSFGCVELIKVNGTPPWYCCTSLLLSAASAPLQDCHRQICQWKLCRCLASMTHTHKCVSATRPASVPGFFKQRQASVSAVICSLTPFQHLHVFQVSPANWHIIQQKSSKCFLMSFIPFAPTSPGAHIPHLWCSEWKIGWGVRHVFWSPFSTSCSFSFLLMDAW